MATKVTLTSDDGAYAKVQDGLSKSQLRIELNKLVKASRNNPQVLIQVDELDDWSGVLRSSTYVPHLGVRFVRETK